MRRSSAVAGLLPLAAISAMPSSSSDRGMPATRAASGFGRPRSGAAAERFIERLNESAGIVGVKGNPVTVGPKFHTLDATQQAATLYMLAAHVFRLPEDGTLQPGQALALVDAKTGKRVGSYSDRGLELD